MTRRSLRALAAPSRSRRCWPAAPSVPTTSGRRCPARTQFRFVDGPRRRSRSPTRRGSQVFEDPALQALIKDAIANNLDLQVGARAGRGSARPCRHREVVLLPAGRRRRQLPARAGRSSERRQPDGDDTVHRERAPTASSCRGKSICSASSGGSRNRHWPWRWPASRSAAACWSR